ncbi:MAG: hypothetical protein EBT08_05390 [Betaproteobacteria bacterium]|nr:hypothetical protein [Betaproteobacteria bacterium]
MIHTDAQTVDPLKLLDEKVYDTRVAFEAAVKHAAEKAKVPDAGDVAQSVTGYVFDFGDMDFGLHTTKAMKAAVEERLKLVFLDVDIPPEVITNCMVHRAWRQGRTGNRFEPHMISLFKLAIAVIGKRAAPAGEGLFSVHAEMFKELCAIKVPDIETARYLTNREKADAAHLAVAEEAAAAAEAEPDAEADAEGSAAAETGAAGPTGSGASPAEPGAAPAADGQAGTSTANGVNKAGAPAAEEAAPVQDPWANSSPFAKTK